MRYCLTGLSLFVSSYSALFSGSFNTCTGKVSHWPRKFRKYDLGSTLVYFNNSGSESTFLIADSGSWKVFYTKTFFGFSAHEDSILYFRTNSRYRLHLGTSSLSFYRRPSAFSRTSSTGTFFFLSWSSSDFFFAELDSLWSTYSSLRACAHQALAQTWRHLLRYFSGTFSIYRNS